jgi:tetratricopeptide (TPR) repeat protein
VTSVPHYSPAGNALVSCVIYLRQMLWPSGLAIPYPYPRNGWPAVEVGFALAIVGAISIFAAVSWKKRPWFIVGWLWYLGMLVPVMGIVQISYYSHADRYTYLPQIGLYLLLTWAAADLSARLPLRRLALGGCSAILLIVLMLCAHTQAGYWKNDQALWNRALAVNANNDVAHNNLGNDLLDKGEVDDAIPHFQEAIAINPRYAKAHYNLGVALERKGDAGLAIAEYQKALEIMPDMVGAHNNLGNALFAKGDAQGALLHYGIALQLNPDFAEAHNNLGNVLLLQQHFDDAIAHFRKALEINPGYAEAHNDLANALLQTGHPDEAVAHLRAALELKPGYAQPHYTLGNIFRQNGVAAEAIGHYEAALKIDPGYLEAQNNLAYMLATCPQASLRNGARAVELASQASRATGGGNPVVLGTLAAAYAESGRYAEAVQTAKHALELATSQANQTLIDALRSQIALYKSGNPLRDESLGQPDPAGLGTPRATEKGVNISR